MARKRSACALAALLLLAIAGCGRQTSVTGSQSIAGAITSVHIVRVFGLRQPTIPPFEATSHDASAARSLAQTIKNLPPFPSGPTSCPADFGVTYTLTFLSGSATAMTATANAAGCQGLTIGGDSQVRWTATGPFWPQVAQTFHVSQSFLWAGPTPPTT